MHIEDFATDSADKFGQKTSPQTTGRWILRQIYSQQRKQNRRCARCTLRILRPTARINLAKRQAHKLQDAGF
jgi:hypothetical protein